MKRIPIELYEYYASEDGFIYNKDMKQIKGMTNARGYYHLKLSWHNVQKHFLIHRLIAITFIPNPDNLPEVNHKNGVKTDNYVDNLEWCTTKENVQHAFDTGLVNHKGMNHPSNKLTDSDVLEIRSLYSKGTLSQRTIGDMFGIKQPQVSSIVRKERWNHI